MGWFTCKANFPTNLRLVQDLARYPELRFLDRFDVVVPAALAACLYALGAYLETRAPGLGTSGMQLLAWGFFVSTVVLFHATCTINSLSHLFGRRRFENGDHSRNNFWLALLTFGEGWHNNHHRYAGAVRQGFYWWELDLTYYLLKLLSLSGLIWQLKPVPTELLREGRTADRRRV
jgi:stearoyl-CoA desaturase (delta-9 desaturase)